MGSETVWIVMRHDIEHDEILGVYATKDIAELAKSVGARMYKSPDERAHWQACKWIEADIEHWPIER